MNRTGLPDREHFQRAAGWCEAAVWEGSHPLPAVRAKGILSSAGRRPTVTGARIHLHIRGDAAEGPEQPGKRSGNAEKYPSSSRR